MLKSKCSSQCWNFPTPFGKHHFIQTNGGTFCTKLTIAGIIKYVVFLRTVQGSRSTPLYWARLAAQVMRFTQSMFSERELRLQCFVDDPITAIAGTKHRRDVILTSTIVLWRAFGFPHIVPQRPTTADSDLDLRHLHD